MTLPTEIGGKDSDISLEKVFIELGNEERIRILLKLFECKTKLSSLSKDLDVAMPEIHRNLARLHEAQLVKRDADGMFSLTSFGYAIIGQLPTFGFLSRHSHYFSMHSVENLDFRFLQTLGALEKTKLVSGIANVMEVFRGIIGNSEKYMAIMTSEAPADLTDFALRNIAEKNLKLRIIMPEDGIVPNRIQEMKEAHHFTTLLAAKNIERRMASRVGLQIVFNENHSAISFPDSNGKADYSQIFFGTDENLHQWCSEYFDFIWSNCDSWNEAKLKLDL
jgi:predicted transcriptional regulator